MTIDATLEGAQRGLPMRAVFGQIVTVYLKGRDTASRQAVLNLITLTRADLSTYQAAVQDPERYDLVRVRMGGWTEFYATMFPAHQDQHQRRQYFTP